MKLSSILVVLLGCCLSPCASSAQDAPSDLGAAARAARENNDRRPKAKIHLDDERFNRSPVTPASQVPAGKGRLIVPDPCQLFTARDVDDLLGGKTSNGVARDGDDDSRYCVYGFDRRSALVVINLFPAKSGKRDLWEERCNAAPDRKPAPGVGDQAFWRSNGFLCVHRGPWLLETQIRDLPFVPGQAVRPDPLELEKRVALKIISQLPSEVAMAPPPPEPKVFPPACELFTAYDYRMVTGVEPSGPLQQYDSYCSHGPLLALKFVTASPARLKDAVENSKTVGLIQLAMVGESGHEVSGVGESAVLTKWQGDAPEANYTLQVVYKNVGFSVSTSSDATDESLPLNLLKGAASRVIGRLQQMDLSVY